MGHGSIAEEVKRRAPERRETSHGGVIAIEEEGVRFRSYLDGAERFMGPETSMEIQAALGSDVALAFDECTPFHVTRDYTARSTERTHRWLDRCVAWHERNAPGVAALLRDRPGRRLRGPASRVGASACRAAAIDGVAIGGSLGRDKDEMRAVVDLTDAAPAGRDAAAPTRSRRRRRPRARGRGRNRHVRLRDAHAARAPRHRAGGRARRALAARSRQGPARRQPRADRRRAVRAPRAHATRAATSTTSCALASSRPCGS